MAPRQQKQDATKTSSSPPTKQTNQNQDPQRQQSEQPLELLLQRAALVPGSLRPADAAQLQRTVGNRAMGKLAFGRSPSRAIDGQLRRQSADRSFQQIVNRSSRQPVIQTKLTLGPVGDRYEQEADSVAKQVVSSISSSGHSSQQPAQRQEEDEDIQMKPAAVVQRQEEDEDIQMKPAAVVQRQEEDEDIQMKPISSVQRQEEEELMMKGDGSLGGGPISGGIETAIQSKRGGGQALADNVRAPMEQAFNADFGGVRVHTDGQSNELNQSLQAKAFTTGSDIFFRQGAYQPGSSSGQELIAHELTHTVQQGAAGVRRSADTVQREETEVREEERQAYREKQISKIEGYRQAPEKGAPKGTKGELSSRRMGGFIGVMKGKMVDVVKNVQNNEGSIQQANNYIHGDAAVNAFFADEIKDAKADNLGAVNKVNAHAVQVLTKKYRAVVMPGGGLQTGPIDSHASSSLERARESQQRVDETAGDRVIVEMYYNQLEKIRDEEYTNESREKAANLYKYAKDRQFNVTKRVEDAKKQRTFLENSGRISTTVQRGLEATKHAVGSAILKVVTLGLFTSKKNRDKRGFVAKEDFNLDLETGKATREELKGGSFEIQGPIARMRLVKAEFDAKMANRKGMGMAARGLSTLSLGLEVAKRFLGIVQGVFNAVAIWSAAISLIPGAQVMALVAAFCGTVSYYMGLLMSSITALRLLLDGMAQIMNDNPSLFAEMSAETQRSALTLGTEGAAYGIGTALSGYARSEVTGQDERFDGEALYDPTKQFENRAALGAGGSSKGPELGSDQWFGDKAIQGGGLAIGGAGMSAANAGGVAAVSGMDNSDMRYTQTVNENRRIGKNSRKQAAATPQEMALMKESYETTKAKAKAAGGKLPPVIRQFESEKAPEPNIEAQAEVPPKDREQAGKVSEASEVTGEVAGEVREGVEEFVNNE